MNQTNLSGFLANLKCFKPVVSATLLLTLIFQIPVGHANSGLFEDRVEYEPTECWNPVDGEAQTDCGWLIVPEDWNAADSENIKIAVAVYHALQPDDSLTPVIYLSGGPAFGPLGKDGKYMNGWRWTADNRFPGRTLIVFDQRGIGLGQPSLTCPEMKDPTLWHPISSSPDQGFSTVEEVHAAYRKCMMGHLEAGRQLHAFNTRQSANDVEALRRALGIDKIVLYGLSYGTRLALTVMDLHPDHIESAILDSVYPPQVIGAYNDANALGPVLDRLFEACARDADCAEAYPDLGARLMRVMQQLEREPVTIEIANMSGFEPVYVRVDHRMFMDVLREEMYQIARLPNLPMLISGVSNGQYWRLKQHVENAVYGHWPGSYSIGASLAVRCNDNAGVANNRVLSLNNGDHAYLNDYVAWWDDYNFCEFWPTRIESQNRSPVVSDIPSLILAGGLDPVTTVEHAEQAAETLRGSHLFVFPALGHVQLRSNECGWEVVDQFLARPDIRPNPGCLEYPRRSGFIIAGGS